MASRKKDLEIIYNLQWKNKNSKGSDKTSVIGVYDIPATTLNWELFKSYLLKNSGTAGDDVIVSYCTDNGKEYPIQSQTDFQVALYAFRNKARNGEVINLKLDRISDQKSLSRQSNDVETQFDNNDSMVSTSCCGGMENPPDWFVSYMAQFKKEINEEVTATVCSVLSSALADLNKPPAPMQNIPAPATVDVFRPRSKSDSKKLRKLQPILTDANNELTPKQIMKSHKFDSKLEKLETRIAKYKEKRLALQQAKSLETEPSTSGKSKSHGHKKDKDRESKQKNKEEKQHKKAVVTQEVEKPAKLAATKEAKQATVLPEKEGRMDAASVNAQDIAPHMLGGEIYLHQWEVVNTGNAPWTSKTSLEYGWGSKALVPLDKVISVPYLKPGDKGTIAVRLEIPATPGSYECYWHFMHKGRRFGEWLGCHIVVDPFDLKEVKSVLGKSVRHSNYSVFSSDEDYGRTQRYRRHFRGPELTYSLLTSGKSVDNVFPQVQSQQRYKDCLGLIEATEKIIDERRPVCRGNSLECLEFVKRVMRREDSDSDNQSVASTDSSVSSKNSQNFQDEFVVVPVPDCFLLDKPNETLLETNSEAPLLPEPSSSKVVAPAQSKLTAEEPEQVDVLGKRHELNKWPNQSQEACDGNNNEDGAKGGNKKREDSSEKDMVFISVPNDEEGDDGFVFVYVDGQKVPIPKKLLKSEYLPKSSTPSNTPKNSSGIQTPVSEKAPSTVLFVQNESQQDTATPTAPKQEEEEPYMSSNYLSHCSAAGSAFSDVNNLYESEREPTSRLFIFPQNRPGYEVVVPAPQEESRRQSGNLPEAVEAINLSDIPTENAPPQNGSGVSQNTPFAPQQNNGAPGATSVHILPENLVSGAVNVASSAINTARSVIKMIAPQREQPGRWVDGHWVSTTQETPREANLRTLAEMGFWNRDLNATLLARYNDDLQRVVAELVQ